MAAASSEIGRDSDRSVHKLLKEWQARAARGERLDPQDLMAALAEATDAAPADLPQTVELPGIHQAGTVSIRPPSDAADPSPSAGFERLSSRLKALTATSPDGEPAKNGLSDYELLREVARGGMGVVYEARQKSLNRIVALKMIKAGELADAEDVARFYSEAEAAANLRHPNIVAVYEVGRAGPGGEQHYFTMDFVAGPSLLDLIRKQPLDGTSAARHLTKIARAIQFAHDRGVLHRDLKPSNILIGEGGEPLVTDFGLAKRIGNDSQLTIAGTVIGTPSYMPPEQAAGNLNQVGPHSDVYSLGAVLYECVTGRPPFVAANIMDVFQQVIQEEPVPPSRLSPKLPRDLETICLKCLQKDRHRRYASAAALADDLDRFLRDEPIAARPVGPIERAIKWARRRPAVAAFWGVLTIAVVLVLGIAGYYNHELSDSNLELSKSLQDVNTQKKLADDRYRAERRNNYATVIQRAEDYWQESPPSVTRSRDLLASLVPQNDQDEDLRGVEWQVLWQMCNTDDRRMLAPRGGIQHLTVLPSGRIAAYRLVEFTRVLEWADLGGKVTREPIGGDRDTSLLRLSSGSDWALGYSAMGRVELRTRQEPGKVIAKLRDDGEQSAAVAISQDGRRIACCDYNGQLTVWSTADRQVELQLDLKQAAETSLKRSVELSMHGVDFSPDGDWLWACGAKELFVADLTTKKVGLASSNRSASLATAAFQPGNKHLALSHKDGQIDLFAVPLKELARPLKTYNSLWLNVRPDVMLYLPGGDMLAVGASSGLVALLNMTDGKARLFRGHTEAVTCLAHSPDGKWLYSGSERGEVLRWDPTVTDQRATILAGAKDAKTEEQLAYFGVDYSPDGRWLAIVGHWIYFTDQPPLGEVVVLDAATRQVVRRVEVPHNLRTCRFTCDSRQLVYGSAEPMSPGRFWLIDVPALSDPREILVGGQKLYAAAPLADGRIALASEDDAVRLWSPASGSVTGEWRPAHPRGKRMLSEMYALVASQNGKCVLSHGEAGLLRLWEAPSGRELLVAPCNLGDDALAVSPDGRLAAFTAANPNARSALATEGMQTAPEVPWFKDFEEKALVFDIERRQLRMIVAGHSSPLRALAFSADGRRLATGDGRGHLILWDTDTGHEVLTLEAHLNAIFGIAFHPSGKQLATVGTDAVVRIWPRK